MNCDQVRQLLHGYLDDELDLATSLEIQKHLPSCADCQKALDAARAISRAAGQVGVYHRAPDVLRDRLRAVIQDQAGEMNEPVNAGDYTPWWKRPMAYSGLAAGVLLLIAAAVLFLPIGSSRGQIDELVASHVRSLEAEHLLDVASTDQHTVKPWFDGKIDFAPPVVDLAGDGFPLIGGRLDYLQQQKVAALIYQRNKHFINVFVWPGNASPEMDMRQGYNLIRFECNGMVCWAVSDLNAGELQQFVDLFKSQKASSTRF